MPFFFFFLSLSLSFGRLEYTERREEHFNLSWHTDALILTFFQKKKRKREKESTSRSRKAQIDRGGRKEKIERFSLAFNDYPKSNNIIVDKRCWNDGEDGSVLEKSLKVSKEEI